MCNNYQISNDIIFNANNLVQVEEKTTVSFFPNPAHKTLFIESDQPIEGEANLTIVNKQGVDVFSIHLSGRKTETNIGVLPTGVYKLKVEGKGFNPIAYKLVKM